MAKVLLAKTRLWHVAAAVALLAGISYSCALRGGFVFDDVPLIVNDKFYSEESDPLMCWTRPYWSGRLSQGLYRPLTVFSYWANAKISGIEPFGFRASGMILHVLTSILVFMYGRNLRLGRNASALAALIFALHPIHAEAVVPAFGRGEILCAFFLIAGLVFHCLSHGRKIWILPAAAAFLLSCWSKEHGVVFLPLCILQDVYLRGLRTSTCLKPPRNRIPPSKGICLPYLAYFLVLAAYFGCRLAFLGTILPSMANFEPGMDNPIAAVPPLLRFVSAVRIQGFAMRLMLWPDVLSYDYSFAQILPSRSVFDISAAATLIAFAGVPLAASRLFPRLKGKLFFLAAAYLLCTVPSGNFIVATGTVFAERLLYIPSIFFIFFSLVLLGRLCSRIEASLRVVAVAAVAVSLGLRTFSRTLDWHSEKTLAASGTTSAPDSAKVWNNYAVQLEREKDFAAASAACGKAIAIYPEYSAAWANRGRYLIALGDTKTAEHCLRKALDINIYNFAAAHNLGSLLANQGRFPEARKTWEESLRLNPDQPALKSNIEQLKKQMER